MNPYARYLFPSVENTDRVLPVRGLRWGYQVTGRDVVVEAFSRNAFVTEDLIDRGRVQITFTFRLEVEEGEWHGDIAELAADQERLYIAALGNGLLFRSEAFPVERIRLEVRQGAKAIPEQGRLSLHWEHESKSCECVMQSSIPGEWKKDADGRGWLMECPDGCASTAVTLSIGQDGEDSYPDVSELLTCNVTSILEHSSNWDQRSSRLAWGGRHYEVLDDLWTGHRLAMFEPAWTLPNAWEGVGRGYASPWYGHWDLTQNILDRVWNELSCCQGEIENLHFLFDEQQGRFRCGARIDKRRMADTIAPPLEPHAALQVFYRDRDSDRLSRIFARFERHFAWFRKKRFHDCVGLFWWAHMFETGYDNIGRAGTTAETNEDFKEYGAVDLCSQLVLYTQDLCEMARILGDEDKSRFYDLERQKLVDSMQNYLWDSRRSVFGDLHVPSGRLETVLTAACFWPLVAGVATREQARSLVEHLLNPQEFWTPFPVATTAVSEEAFELDMWRGPVWVSQNFWIIRGLRRYNYLEEAAEVAERTLQGLQKVWDRDRKIYEFYHPVEFYPDGLTRKGRTIGPTVYYTGHNPLHCVVLEGLWGLEACVDGCRCNPPERLLETPAEVSCHWGDRRLHLCSDGEGTVKCNGEIVLPGQLIT